MGATQTITKGQEFGRLSIIKELPRRKFSSGQTQRLFLCSCICGKEATVQLANLKSGNTTSCGCFSIEDRFGRNLIHGKSKDLLYGVYRAMLERCYNEKHVSYKNYGARGITVCKRWRNKKTGLENFYKWALFAGYEQGLELDREKTNGRYCPENCRFVTHSVNNRNTRKTLMYKGISLQDYFDKYNKGVVTFRTFSRRVKRGWSIKDAAPKPNQKGSPLTKKEHA